MLVLVGWATVASSDLLPLTRASPGDALPAGWVVRPVRGARAPSSAIHDSSGERFLRLEGRGAAAWFVRTVAVGELPARGTLTWRWRVPLPPRDADVRVAARDDAALRVFVVFDHRGRFSRIPRTIFYTVTDSTLAGYQGRSRQSGDLMIVGVRATSAGTQWQHTTRDPLADYRAFWRDEPPRIVAIGFMQDAEQTGSAVVADIMTLTWSDTHDER